MSDAIKYEEGRKTDYKQLLEMSSLLFKESDRSELEKMLDHSFSSDHIKILVAREANQKCVGFAMLSIRTDYVEGAEKSPTGYLEGIYVEPGYRAMGIAKHFVKWGEQWMKDNHCTQIGSDTWLTDQESRNFHKKLGFWEEDELVHFLKNIE